MTTILDKREVSLARVGPRELKDPRSREYAIQTLYSLKLHAEGLAYDKVKLAKEVAEIEQYRHWEVLGYPTKEAMFSAELTDAGVMAVTAAQRGQEAAKATTGEVLPADGSVNPGNASEFKNHTQASRAAAAGISKAAQERLDALARKAPDLLARVQAGEMSAHAAAVQAGIVKAVWSAPVEEDDLERALAKRYPSWRIVRVAP